MLCSVRQCASERKLYNCSVEYASVHISAVRAAARCAALCKSLTIRSMYSIRKVNEREP